MSEGIREMFYEEQPEPEVVEPLQAASTGRTLNDLTPDNCRWCAEVDGTFIFCEEDRRDIKTSYCATHHAVVWVKAPRRIVKRVHNYNQAERKF